MKEQQYSLTDLAQMQSELSEVLVEQTFMRKYLSAILTHTETLPIIELNVPPEYRAVQNKLGIVRIDLNKLPIDDAENIIYTVLEHTEKRILSCWSELGKVIESAGETIDMVKDQQEIEATKLKLNVEDEEQEISDK